MLGIKKRRSEKKSPNAQVRQPSSRGIIKATASSGGCLLNPKRSFVLGAEFDLATIGIKYHTAPTFAGTLDGFAASTAAKFRVGGEFGYSDKYRSYAFTLASYGATISVTEDNLLQAISISKKEKKEIEFRRSLNSTLDERLARVFPELWLLQDEKLVTKENGQKMLGANLFIIPMTSVTGIHSFTSSFKVSTEAILNEKLEWVPANSHWKSDAYRKNESEITNQK